MVTTTHDPDGLKVVSRPASSPILAGLPSGLLAKIRERLLTGSQPSPPPMPENLPAIAGNVSEALQTRPKLTPAFPQRNRFTHDKHCIAAGQSVFAERSETRERWAREKCPRPAFAQVRGTFCSRGR